MTAPKPIIDLVALFTTNRESYCSSSYKETELRQEFLNPFFEALGWDISNKQAYAEAYKEVVHEEALKVGTSTRAPDYSFRIGGMRKFFVEAKTPSVNIKEDIEPAYQLRRYAWSAKLPLSILTDFEEFSVYDCRQKPNKNDKASVGRTLYIKFDEYEKRWDEIAAVFSKEAVLKGSFDKYAESVKGKKGTSEVDDEFLEEISRWRDLLAKNIAINNPKLSQRELNFAVQRTIDRLIFLRICEDRGIEHYGTLMALLNGDNVYRRIRQNFQRADEIYNSGLFHFRDERGRAEPPDTLTLSLCIDDKPLKDIIENLYYPDSPYEFSVLPADILGQVYEQFLGKVIRLTAGHQAKVEEKPEVKKSGGVFYTPTYIVDYIVKNTVGKLIEGKTPKQIEKLKILDPACGSGTFLIQAYQFLLDHYRDWYLNDGIEKHSKGKEPKIVQVRSGEWRLSTPERKKILIANIHGVDIDSQAVEVTKLSLLLKVLEGENEQTISQQLKLFHERALPDLENNIKCGNSLIGTDYYQFQGVQEVMSLYDDDTDDERFTINPFDWDGKNGFAEIMKSGGFDAVIGNPPWGATFSEQEVVYFRTSYHVAQSSNVDSYALFIESALIRLRNKGLLGFITPDTYLRKDDHLYLRQLVLQKNRIIELIETGPVFSGVRDTWCLVLIAEKSKPDARTRICHKKISRFVVAAEERLEKVRKCDWDIETKISQSVWMYKPLLIVGYLATEVEQRIIERIESFTKLGELTDRFTISRGEEGSKFALRENPKGDYRIIIPQDIGRYTMAEGLRVTGKSLTPGKIESIYTHPKLWIIRIQKMRWKQRVVCSLDKRVASAGMKTLQSIVSTSDNLNDLKYLQAILASKLINFWCINYLADDMNQSYLSKLPICSIDTSTPANKSNYNKIIANVTNILEYLDKLPLARTDHEKTLLQRQIDSTDQKIDELVYELYGLTKEEIAIVEGQK